MSPSDFDRLWQLAQSSLPNREGVGPFRVLSGVQADEVHRIYLELDAGYGGWVPFLRTVIPVMKDHFGNLFCALPSKDFQDLIGVVFVHYSAFLYQFFNVDVQEFFNEAIMNRYPIELLPHAFNDMSPHTYFDMY